MLFSECSHLFLHFLGILLVLLKQLLALNELCLTLGIIEAKVFPLLLNLHDE